jgi:hypothetical protein
MQKVSRELSLSLDHAWYFVAGLPYPACANHPSMRLR